MFAQQVQRAASVFDHDASLRRAGCSVQVCLCVSVCLCLCFVCVCVCACVCVMERSGTWYVVCGAVRCVCDGTERCVCDGTERFVSSWVREQGEEGEGEGEGEVRGRKAREKAVARWV